MSKKPVSHLVDEGTTGPDNLPSENVAMDVPSKKAKINGKN